MEKGLHKGSATDFDESVWFNTRSRAMNIEEVLIRHSAIMDQYDPEKKIGMMVDEWGCWHDVEPGTNPGFLYQQNTMRDALTAGVSLNIFNKHCDRIKMACIAQIVNVLQSVILTEGKKMLLTPTYHVFHMYKYHQDAQLVESWLEGTGKIGLQDEEMVPDVQESVSEDKDGVLTITLNNLSPEEEREVEVVLTTRKPAEVEARIVRGRMQAYNTFEEPETVKEEAFTQIQVTDRGLSFTLPACSVMMIRVKQNKE